MNQPDIIVLGSVVTMFPEQPMAEAIAVKDGMVSAIGSACEVLALGGVGTHIIDCRGHTVLPGFIDAHCHILASAAAQLSVDCSPGAVRSIADIQARLKDKKDHLPAGAWIRAVGYNEFYLKEGRHPDRYDLDQVVPSNPVRLIHRSGHVFVLNSLAMSLMGIDASTEDPPGGLIDRDPVTGEPNGIFIGAVDYWDRRLPPLDEIELARGMDIFGRMLVANGVTSVLDATVTNDYDDWRILDDFCRSGSLKSRVSMMVSLEAMADFCECGTAMSALGAVRIGGVKVVLDEVDAGLSMKLDALENVLVTAHLAGYQIAVHAVEGQPLASAVNLLAKVMSKVPGKGHRHRIEHCALCPPEVRRQIKELGLIVVSQPGFIYQNGERYLQTVARGDIPDLYPFRSLVKEGVVVAAGSDSPVGVLSPVVGMYAAVTRRAENGQVVGIEQAVGPEVAIAMYTRDAAYATFGEFSFGTIAPGKRADMVVLSDNPLSCSCDQIKNIKVEMTLVEGRVVYEV